MSTHEDFEQWMAEQSGWNPYPDLLEAWQAATALRDAEIAQLKAERDALAEQLRISRQSERESWRYKEDLTAERDALLKDAEHWRVIVTRLLGEVPGKDRGDGNAPGHSHHIPGVWDSHNGEKSGEPCEWCAAWNEAKEAMASSSKEGK